MVPPTARRPTPSNLFSFSRLKTFDQCPRRYHFRYVEGLAEAFRSIESHLGTTVHAVLEWLYRTRDEHADPTPEAMLAEFARSWDEGLGSDVAVVRLSDDPLSYHAIGREMLTGFYQGVFRRDRSRTVALEQRLSMRLSEGITFTGFADRVGRTAAGRLFVVDYKTSRTEGNASDFSEGLQAPLYAACLLDRHGDEEALAGYHYLRHGSTRWSAVRAREGSDLWRRFTVQAEEALAARDFPARPGALCAWCGFNQRCPEAQVPQALSGGLEHARNGGDSDSV